MKCPSEEQIILLYFNEIDTEETKQKILSHIDKCRKCKTKLEKYSATITYLKNNKHAILSAMDKNNAKGFNFEELNLHNFLKSVFLRLVLILSIFVFIVVSPDLHKTNKEVNSNHLEKFVFQFEEVEEAIIGGEIWYEE